jgi:hypothetical protein
VRVVPANGMLCLRKEEPDGVAWTCVTPAEAKAGKLTLTSRDETGGLLHAVGVLPDGDHGLYAVNAGRRQTGVPASEGVYAIRAGETTAVGYTDASGDSAVSPLP